LPIIDDRNFHEFFLRDVRILPRLDREHREWRERALFMNRPTSTRAYRQRDAEGGAMSLSSVHSKGADAPITIPAIGLDLMVGWGSG
jgi:hypothetical protein